MTVITGQQDIAEFFFKTNSSVSAVTFDVGENNSSFSSNSEHSIAYCTMNITLIKRTNCTK